MNSRPFIAILTIACSLFGCQPRSQSDNVVRLSLGLDPRKWLEFMATPPISPKCQEAIEATSRLRPDAHPLQAFWNFVESENLEDSLEVWFKEGENLQSTIKSKIKAAYDEEVEKSAKILLNRIEYFPEAANPVNVDEYSYVHVELPENQLNDFLPILKPLQLSFNPVWNPKPDYLHFIQTLKRGILMDNGDTLQVVSQFILPTLDFDTFPMVSFFENENHLPSIDFNPPFIGYATEANMTIVDSFLALPQVRRLVPSNVSFAWNSDAEDIDPKFGKYYGVIPIQNPATLRDQLNGTKVENARATPNEASDEFMVILVFNEEGKKIFGRLTRSNVGNSIAILVDGKVVCFPRVNSPVLNGYAQITGNFSQKEAIDLANAINNEALAFPMLVLDQKFR